MKKFVFLALAAVIGLGGGFLIFSWFYHQQQEALQSSSREFISVIVEPALREWNPEYLELNQSDDLEQNMGGVGLQRYFTDNTAVGVFQNIEQIDGGIRQQSLLHMFDPVTAEYSIEALYSNSSATVMVGLIRVDDAWRVSRFNIRTVYTVQ